MDDTDTKQEGADQADAALANTTTAGAGDGPAQEQAADPADGEAGPDPVAALQKRAEAAEAEASAANSQLLLIQGKLAELNLEPEPGEGESYAIGEVAADKLAHFQSQNERLNTELRDTIAERDKLQQQLDAAAVAAKASPAPKGKGKPRPINAKAVKKPLSVLSDPEKGTISVADQLLELVQIAETIEVAFSDGTSELADLPAMRISGNAWRITQVGLQLTLETLLVEGPRAGTGAIALKGYGLLLDGELVHFQPRSDALEILGGQTTNLAPDICFS